MTQNDNWIDDVIGEVRNDIETPISWLWWSLVAAVSATASNNYFVTSFNGNHIYKPNLYIMLLGDSGKGKAYGINLAKSLVSKADVTRVIAGRSSIQSIVTDLATSKSREDGKVPIRDSRAFIVNGELSSAIIADVSSLAIMTDLYDGTVNEEWVNNLKMGKEKINNPCITALFGSSPAHFYGTIPMDNIQGGYIGRNLIDYQENHSQIVDPFSDNDALSDKVKDYLIPKYIVHLQKIASLKGQLKLTGAAKGLYNPWRRRWKETPSKDKTGFVTRVPDHVVKVAMCLSLSRYDSCGEISEEDIQDSITKVTGLIYANSLTTEGRGLDPSAGQSKLVIDLLIRAEGNQLNRKKILSHGHGNFDSFALDKILETLGEMGWISKERIGVGKNIDWLVRLSGQPLERYLEYTANNNRSLRMKDK